MADTIPTELIERTLSFAASIDTPTCLAVSLTNKLGLGAARSLLYRDIRIPGQCDDELVDDRMRKWSTLCRTLLGNRALARHVQSLVVYMDDLENYTFKIPPPLDEGSLWKFVNEDLVATSKQRAEIVNWFEYQRQLNSLDDLEDDEEDPDNEIADLPPVFGPGVYLGIAIIACPNLKLLGVGGNIPALTPVTELHDAIEDQPDPEEEREGPLANGFGSIEEVIFKNFHEYDEDATAGEVNTIMSYSQNLKKVTIERFFGDARIDQMPPFGNPPSTIEELYIRHAVASYADDLEQLLEACPQLKVFALKWSEVCDVYRETEWRALATALVRCNPLLEELRLDIPHHNEVREVFMGTVPNNFDELPQAEQDEMLKVNNEGLGSLEDLRHLRKLAVPQIALFGVFDDPDQRDREWTLAEVLPSSVQEVEIFCEGIDFTDDDRALLNAPGTARLQDITIYNALRDRWISKKNGEGGEDFGNDN